MRQIRAVWLLIASLSFAACADLQSTSSTSADQRLDRLVDDYYEAYLRLDPLAATYIGDTRYNDVLAIDIAPDHIAKLVDLHRRMLAASRRIDLAQLSDSRRLSKQIFEYECRQALESARFPRELLPIDQLSGLPTTFAELGSGESAQPFNTVRDYENFLHRAQFFSRWIDQAIANMREGTRRGVVQPRVVIEKVLPQLDAMLVPDVQQSLFYKPIENLPGSFSERDKARLRREYRAAIGEIIIPAYRRLDDYIRNDYWPHARQNVDWSALPDGAAWYQWLVRQYTTTDMSPEQIHALGLTEVARIRTEMRGIQTQLNIPGDLTDFFRALAGDPKQYFASGEELLAAHQAVKAKIAAALPRLFIEFPQADFKIREVEPFRAQAAAGAFYQPPSADGTRPGVFYVNTYNLKAQPKFGITTLSLHEASPGHHFQVSMQQEIGDLPKFRRFLVGYTAYVEGWALYSEWLGREMGLFTDPYQYFGHLNDEMLRAMRLVVDTGLHTKQWTRERAIAYMLENSYMAPSDAEAEVERYIADPAQALSYKIGQIKIRELREYAQRTLGARFDVKAFHRQVLHDGALPMDLLDAKIKRWVASYR